MLLGSLLLPIAMGVLGAGGRRAFLFTAPVWRLTARECSSPETRVRANQPCRWHWRRSGFTYISDDWTYLRCARRPNQCPRNVGTGEAAARLRKASSLLWLHIRSAPALNEELAYELLHEELGAQVHFCCEPRWFFFLERSTRRSAGSSRFVLREARQYVERSVERLPPELADIAQRRAAIMANIASLSCWKLTYGGPPEIAVRGLHELLSRAAPEVSA